MEITTKEGFDTSRAAFLDRINQGEIFVYPTDTIYGIGCSALNTESVEKIRAIKERDGKSFSVIAPSKGWIRENCHINSTCETWLDRLPGPYTLVLKIRNGECVAKTVARDKETLGVRIPNHWISEVVAELGIPIVTTSVNTSGGSPIKSISSIDDKKRRDINFAIDERTLDGKPSKIIILTEDKPRIIKR